MAATSVHAGHQRVPRAGYQPRHGSDLSTTALPSAKGGNKIVLKEASLFWALGPAARPSAQLLQGYPDRHGPASQREQRVKTCQDQSFCCKGARSGSTERTIIPSPLRPRIIGRDMMLSLRNAVQYNAATIPAPCIYATVPVDQLANLPCKRRYNAKTLLSML